MSRFYSGMWVNLTHQIRLWVDFTHQIGYNLPMGIGSLKAWICDVCGYRWPVDDRRGKPDRCRNSECRSRKWDCGSEARPEAQRSPKPPVAGSNPAAPAKQVQAQTGHSATCKCIMCKGVKDAS